MQGGISSLSFLASIISDKLNLESYIILKLIRDLKVHLDHEFATGAKKHLTLFMHKIQTYIRHMEQIYGISGGGQFFMGEGN